MRFVVTGAKGMLGSDLVALLSDRDVLPLGHEDLDITNLSAIRSKLRDDDVILNCAAYNKVDEAESNPAAALSVNAYAVHNLSIAAREKGLKFLTVSSDYVFDGLGESPYGEHAITSPQSSYGRSKAEGETRALGEHPDGTYIVRTAWLYGSNGRNFAQTMLDLAQNRESLSVVNDQRGQPTWSMDLAKKIVELIDSGAPSGIYHGTNSGSATWFDFARAVLAEAQLDPDRVLATDSSAYIRPAVRPPYSVLGHNHWTEVGLKPMRPWQEALHAAFTEGVFTY